MAGDVKDTEAVELPADIDIIDPFKPFGDAVAASQAAIVAAVALAGAEIIRLDAAAAPVPQNQYVRLRVRYVIVNPVTAGALTLTLGRATYPFDGAARSLAVVPFPIVVERGTDMSCVGADGRIYLVGDPE